MQKHVFKIAALLLCSIFASVSWAQSTYGPRHIQALVGEFDGLEAENQGITDADGEEVVLEDFPSTLPYLGASVQFAQANRRFEYGLESGGFFSWKDIETSYVYANGTAYLGFDSDMLLFELFLGGYAGLNITDRLRFYASAGPMLMVAYVDGLESDDEPSVEPRGAIIINGQPVSLDKSEIDSGAGWYARAGIDFAVSKTLVLGLTVRHIDNELSFDDSVGTVVFEGEQIMLTFGKRY